MSKKPRPLFIMGIGLILVLLVFSFLAGVHSAELVGRIGPNASSGETPDDFLKLAEIWGVLKQYYVDKDILNPKAQSEGAIKGMLATLDDPFTRYMDAEHYRLEMDDLQGKFEGIGAHVGLEDGRIVILAPMPGSPAENAGVKPGDIIVKVDGLTIEGLSLNEVVLRVRGPRDTTVKLEILRRGESQSIEIEIVRAEIALSTVFSRMLDDIAYLRIAYFADNTDDDILPEIQRILDKSPTGVILDLRSNPGGLLEVVVSVANNFLDEGDVIVHTVDSEKRTVSSTAKYDGLLRDTPLVVLINEFSASGSEVLAGALQDNNRAVLVGIDTFGKSAVNVIIPLSDGSAVVVTTAHWLTPGGHQIGKDKIRPDIEVRPLEGDETEDVQLQRALDYLKGK